MMKMNCRLMYRRHTKYTDTVADGNVDDKNSTDDNDDCQSQRTFTSTTATRK